MKLYGAYRDGLKMKKEFVIPRDSLDEDVTTEIRSGLRGLVPGGKDKIIDGIAGFISTGLRTVQGAENGEEYFEKSYYLAIEGSSVIRLYNPHGMSGTMTRRGLPR